MARRVAGLDSDASGQSGDTGSGMADLQTDDATLRELASSCRAVAEEMSTAAAEVACPIPAGDPAVDPASADFFASLTYQLRLLSAGLTVLAAGTDHAASAYAAADEGLAGSLPSSATSGTPR